MKTPNQPLPYRSTPASGHPRHCRPAGQAGLLLLGVTWLFPCTLLAQPPAGANPPPGFSQTAEAPPAHPAEPKRAGDPPQPSLPPAAAPALPVTQRGCSCDWVRDGFYLRISTSAAHTTFSGHGPAGTAKIAGLGGGSSIAIGASILRGLVVAGMIQSNQGTANFDGGPYQDAQFSAHGETITVTRKALATASQIGLLIDWYPMEKQGLHAGLSGGVSVVTVNNHADETNWHGFGTGGSLFVGYDWPLASTLAMGVSFVVSSATSSSLKDQDSKETGYKLKPFSMGLAGSLLFF
jgi:hypothetical protein